MKNLFQKLSFVSEKRLVNQMPKGNPAKSEVVSRAPNAAPRGSKAKLAEARAAFEASEKTLDKAEAEIRKTDIKEMMKDARANLPKKLANQLAKELKRMGVKNLSEKEFRSLQDKVTGIIDDYVQNENVREARQKIAKLYTSKKGQRMANRGALRAIRSAEPGSAVADVFGPAKKDKGDQYVSRR